MRGLVKRLMGQRRIEALALAVEAYDNHMFFGDWDRRGPLFKVQDMLDTDTRGGAEAAFYVIGSMIEDLNDAKYSKSP